jgi:predicted DNA-binding protein (MmcQ/YjbR family)
LNSAGCKAVKLEAFNTFCASLPHTTHVVQWGGAHVWKVGGKVFAIGWFDGSVDNGITFKCSPVSFEMLKEQEGCRPAPYLASRGMKWIQRTSPASLSDKDLKIYLRESHKLAAATLTKKMQRELGLA